MSQITPGDNNQEVTETPKLPLKCRIPQRLPSTRQRAAAVRNKPALISSEPLKSKFELVTIQHNSRFIGKSASRPRSTESRPKSANRKDELNPGKMSHVGSRSNRPSDRERITPALKRPSVISKRAILETMMSSNNKLSTPVIKVPVSHKQGKGGICKISGLPDQETIKKCEELELLREISNITEVINELNEEELVPQGDRAMRLKTNWEDKMKQFEKMKIDLNGRQKALMELYSMMRETHQKMAAMGIMINLPPPEELCILNVAQISPEQLLQLFAGKFDDKPQNEGKGCLTVDVTKLYNMPNKLVATCEQTLAKRKEIIDWFENLKNEEKGISKSKIAKKINEFNAENEMLNCSLQTVKSEFQKELNEIVDYLRKGVKETMTLQLRTEKLTYELSELNAQNTDLRKQIHIADSLKSGHTRHKIEELEKELKEEKCKKLLMRDRLTRAEGQIKIGAERASQLEAALEQARSQIWTLERTVHELKEQNQKLQTDFDKELSKLTDSIRENTMHLEEIAEAREKLQAEKEDLEHRLQALSENYNESLLNMQHKLNINIGKLIETENKFGEEKEERTKLETKLESLSTELVESELRYKEILRQLQERELQLNNALNYQKDLEVSKRQLDAAHMEIEEYRNRLTVQNETIREIEHNFNETINIEAKLKQDLRLKEDYIAELEKKKIFLEHQLQESEYKMESYEKQLTTLKNNISQLQDDFGQFENLNELRDMANQQRSKLLEATCQNGELLEALRNKDIEIERHIKSIADQEQILEERDAIIKCLSKEKEEQTNIIKLLRQNLEMRAQADSDLSQQLSEKNAEIDVLITNVETRKLQISQLEKIILKLKDQLRKDKLQRREDRDKITELEKAVAEYESYHKETKRRAETPSENLDNLIKILEDELSSPFEPQLKEQDYRMKFDQIKSDTLGKIEYQETKNDQSPSHAEEEKIPTKIIVGNFVKRTYITASANEEQNNLGRKKAITSIETQKLVPHPENTMNLYAAPLPTQDNFPPFKECTPPNEHFTRNLQAFLNNQFRDEKKGKMFKFTGHRL